MQLLLEEHRRQGVLPFLSQFALHAINGCFKEECYKMLIRSLCSNLLQSRDIFRTVFKFDNQQRMAGLQ